MLIPNKSLDLDKIDLKILDVLQREGRVTKAKLAEMVNLSQNPCGIRVARLETAKLIRGYHADVDLHRLARFDRFIVAMTLENDLPAMARRFESYLQKCPNVIECEAVLGDIDYFAVVVATSIEHYIQIMETVCAQGADVKYTTYPCSKMIKRSTEMVLADLSVGSEDAQ